MSCTCGIRAGSNGWVPSVHPTSIAIVGALTSSLTSAAEQHIRSSDVELFRLGVASMSSGSAASDVGSLFHFLLRVVVACIRAPSACSALEQLRVKPVRQAHEVSMCPLLGHGSAMQAQDRVTLLLEEWGDVVRNCYNRSTTAPPYNLRLHTNQQQATQPGHQTMASKDRDDRTWGRVSS